MARYVGWLEIFGYLFIGTLVAAMIGSAVYKIDDAMKFSGVAAAPRSEPIAVPAEAFVDSVAVENGAEVKKGQVLLQVTSNTQDLALLKSMRSTQDALDALRGGGAAPAGFEASLKDALDRGKAAARREPPHAIIASVPGVVATDGKEPPLGTLAGKIVSTQVGTIFTYDSLRFPVPLAGENSLRVRINLLAEPDILDWKALTRDIKAEKPPEAPAVRRIWKMLDGKLEEIKPDQIPLKRSMPEIVGAMNELLRRPDFYDAADWAGKPLPAEARKLLDKGTGALTSDELIRLNRFALVAAMPGVIAESANEHQAVKAKLYIPVLRRTPEGKTVKDKPLIFPVTGNVAKEPEGGKVVIELTGPPPQVVEYMKRQRAGGDLAPVIATGTIVVGRISLFRFLFK